MMPTACTTFDAYFAFLKQHAAGQLTRSVALWRGGVASEQDFWSRWFATRGLEWPEDYAVRLKPAPLVPWLAELLPPKRADERLHLLDVGAGPITKSGTFVPDRRADIVACDPLAKIYAAIMREHGVDPPLTTAFAFAEDLSARFDAASFDIVSCTNALDHALEPVWGILEMLTVTKQGGWVFLGHRRNEAEFERYAGLHQWNFDEADGDFVVWNLERKINVTQVLSGFARTRNAIAGDHISTRIQRTGPLPVDPLTYQRTLRAALLEALLST